MPKQIKLSENDVNTSFCFEIFFIKKKGHILFFVLSNIIIHDSCYQGRSDLDQFSGKQKICFPDIFCYIVVLPFFTASRILSPSLILFTYTASITSAKSANSLSH